MSEEKEILDTETKEQIQTVLQLPEHATTTTLTVGSVNSEGEPLVSLDDLYVLTGQESIQKVVRGFNKLLENEKLSRENMDALKISGTENFVPGYNRLNAIKGAEGFFSTLKDGIVYIVKSIIAFIKGIYNWVVDRLKALFGVGKTSKEVSMLNDRTDDINRLMTELISKFGVNELYDPMELASILPKGFTDRETLSFIKSKLLSNKESIEALIKVSPKFDEAIRVIEKQYENSKKANDLYQRGLNKFKGKIRNGNATEADIIELSHAIRGTIPILDLTAINNMISELLEQVYGIEFKDIGVENNFQQFKEIMKVSLEQRKVNFSPELVEDIKRITKKSVYSTIVGANKNGVAYKDATLPIKAITNIKNMVNEPDGKLFEQIAKQYPDFSISKELPGHYLTFCNAVSATVTSLDNLVILLQHIKSASFNLIKWYNKTSSLITSYITRDIKEILEAHKKFLTEKEIADGGLETTVESNDGKFITTPSYLLDLDATFSKKYPGWRIPETISAVNEALLQVDIIQKPLKNFVDTFRKV